MSYDDDDDDDDDDNNNNKSPVLCFFLMQYQMIDISNFSNCVHIFTDIEKKGKHLHRLK